MSALVARPIRAAIVGAGLMGRWHAHELVRVGGRLVAVADMDSSLAQRLANGYRAGAFASLDELLARDQFDVLHICTPPQTHVELAERALAAGAHVIVEKPLAPDLPATTRLLALAQSAHRLLVPVHQFIFQRGVQSALARLQQVAPLVHLDTTIATAGGEGKDDRARDELVFEIIPHALALFCRFLPNGFDDASWDARSSAAGELRVLGQAESISLAINVTIRGRPTRNVFTVIGEEGSFRADLFHGFGVFEGNQVSRARKIVQPFAESIQTLSAATLNLAVRALQNEPAYPGLRGLIHAFYRSISAGAPAPISPEEILAVARTRDGLMALSALKRNV